jgi:hypothetical protein
MAKQEKVFTKNFILFLVCVFFIGVGVSYHYTLYLLTK